jgi:hypothetical protein
MESIINIKAEDGLREIFLFINRSGNEGRAGTNEDVNEPSVRSDRAKFESCLNKGSGLEGLARSGGARGGTCIYINRGLEV